MAEDGSRKRKDREEDDESDMGKSKRATAAAFDVDLADEEDDDVSAEIEAAEPAAADAEAEAYTSSSPAYAPTSPLGASPVVAAAAAAAAAAPLEPVSFGPIIDKIFSNPTMEHDEASQTVDQIFEDVRSMDASNAAEKLKTMKQACKFSDSCPTFKEVIDQRMRDEADFVTDAMERAFASDSRLRTSATEILSYFIEEKLLEDKNKIAHALIRMLVLDDGKSGEVATIVSTVLSQNFDHVRIDAEQTSALQRLLGDFETKWHYCAINLSRFLRDVDTNAPEAEAGAEGGGGAGAEETKEDEVEA